MRFLNYKKLFLALVILTLFVSLSCASAEFDPDIVQGGEIEFTVNNVDGCQWVVSDCGGATLLSERTIGSHTIFEFLVTQKQGIVRIDLVNSNGETIDTRSKSWDERRGNGF